MVLYHSLSEEDAFLFRRNISQLEEQIINHLPADFKAPEIFTAIRSVPRHLFVDASYRYMAYTDNALPTRCGQTTSAPSLIAKMIYLSGIKRGDTVLEIGTGTGYEAAILHEMGLRVFTIEIEKNLADTARRLFSHLEYSITLYNGNGIDGLSEHAPYKGILIPASVSSLNRILHLKNQLSAAGGRIIVPVGKQYQQLLHIVERKGNRYATWSLGKTPVSFVPLTGGR